MHNTKIHKEPIQSSHTMFSLLIMKNISILQLRESPRQTSRHLTVRQEINHFSQFFDTNIEAITSNNISQNV